MESAGTVGILAVLTLSALHLVKIAETLVSFCHVLGLVGTTVVGIFDVFCKLGTCAVPLSGISGMRYGPLLVLVFSASETLRSL